MTEVWEGDLTPHRGTPPTSQGDPIPYRETPHLTGRHNTLQGGPLTSQGDPTPLGGPLNSQGS